MKLEAAISSVEVEVEASFIRKQSHQGLSLG